MIVPRARRIPPPVWLLLTVLLAVLCPLTASATEPSKLMKMEVTYKGNTYQFTNEGALLTSSPAWPEDSNYPAVSYDNRTDTWLFGGDSNQKQFDEDITITVDSSSPANVEMNGGTAGISGNNTSVTVNGSVVGFKATANKSGTMKDESVAIGNVTVNCTGDVLIRNTATDWASAANSVTVENAGSVTIQSNSSSVYTLKNSINSINSLNVVNCSGDVTLENQSGAVASQRLQIKAARDVTITGNSNTRYALGELPYITCSGTVILENTGGSGITAYMAALGYRIKLSDTSKKTAYYTSKDAKANEYTFTAPTSSLKYLKIMPCTEYGITVTEGEGENARIYYVTSLNKGDVLGDGTMKYENGLLKFEGTDNSATMRIFKIDAGTADVELTSKKLNDLGGVTITNANNVTITGENGGSVAVRGNVDIDCKGTVYIYGKVGSWVGDGSPNNADGNLTVKNANSVQVQQSNNGAGINGDATFTDCGEVSVNFPYAGSIAGKVTVSGNKTKTAGIYVTSIGNGADITCSDKVAINANQFIGDLNVTNAKVADVTLRAAITGDAAFNQCEDVTLTNRSSSGTIVTGTLTITLPEGKKYRITTDDGQGNLVALDEISNEYGYLHVAPAYTVTVQGGKANTAEACKDENVTITAVAPTADPADSTFEGWEAVSPTNLLIYSKKQQETSFQMKAENAVVKANWNVARAAVTVDGGTVNGSAGPAKVDVGETVKIAAAPAQDGQVFDKWELVKAPADFTFTDVSNAEPSFTMPAGDVELKATYKADATQPTQPTEPDTPENPDNPGGSTEPDTPAEPEAPAADSSFGEGVAVVALGGAAIYGGYEIATRVILHQLLPEGAAIPKNRAELAVLVWNTAGRPEPVSAPAFADIADADTAKAAQWCAEQGYLEAKGEDTFNPTGWTPKFRVIEVWNKAFPQEA